MSTHDKINYVELPATDLAATRRFFEEVFGWTFADFGPDYTAFTNAGLRGGFFRSDLRARTANGSALVVLYSDDLEDTQRKVEAAGGVTLKDVFPFPGGRRFHFSEPSGNEFAVWSDRPARAL